jgi:Uma2 family endonuclease
MTTTAIKIGPADNGRRMSLADFEHAEVQPGYLYELGRGVIVVSDVPNPPHLWQVNAVRLQLTAYQFAHKGRISAIVGGGECKILLDDQESERHPDLSVYLTPPPGRDSDVWSIWVPALVIEVVSPDSRDRDYNEKREEYLSFGVQEYWIFDAERGEMTVLRRTRGRWREQIVRPPDVYRSKLFPGLELDCGQVFEAAREVGG